MEQPYLNGNAKAGTLGGTLLVFLFKIGLNDLLTSAVLAAVGAAVSFTVSVMLKLLLKWIMRKKVSDN